MLGFTRKRESRAPGRERGLLRRAGVALGWAVAGATLASVPFPVVGQLVWLLVWLFVPALWATALGGLGYLGWRRVGRPGEQLLERAAAGVRRWPARIGTLISRRVHRVTATCPTPSGSSGQPGVLELAEPDRSTQ